MGGTSVATAPSSRATAPETPARKYQMQPLPFLHQTAKKKMGRHQMMKMMRKKKVAEALKKLERENAEADRLSRMDERKRPYNSMVDSKAPTEEELEAYALKRQRSDDPMAAFLNKK